MKDLARNLANLVDFASMCDFDAKGHCVARRSEHNPIHDKACCGGCANSRGYIDKLGGQFSTWPREYAVRWDKQDGFWQAGIGCTLPRHLRSNVCIFYTCGHPATRNPVSSMQLTAFSHLSNRLRDIFRWSI